MKKETRERIKNSGLFKDIDESFKCKMYEKIYCKCEVKVIQIVTESYCYCKECGGVIKDLTF